MLLFYNRVKYKGSSVPTETETLVRIKEKKKFNNVLIGSKRDNTMIKQVYSVTVSDKEELFESAVHAGLAYARAILGMKPYTKPMKVTMRDDSGAVVRSNHLKRSIVANYKYHNVLREMYGNIWNL